ncbi:MAG: hypothetical protein IKB28_02580 [Clostridia bacterium]|nr:hypothetical protein [Clostridia bacterium]
MTYYNRSATTNANVGVREGKGESLLSVLFSLPVALWQFLCALGAKRVFKGTSLTFCIFAFFGVVGGIEAGVVSFGFGAVVTVLLVIIEILCLKQ